MLAISSPYCQGKKIFNINHAPMLLSAAIDTVLFSLSEHSKYPRRA